MKESDKNDLASIVNDAVMNVDSTKEAIETLHPKDEKNVKKIDKLSILNPTQIDAMGVIEWQDRALACKPGDWGKHNITEGFTDKIKALHVSRGGVGRGEVSNVFKPAIFGQMMENGMIPQSMMENRSMGVHKPSFIGRLFGRNQ